MKVVALHCSFQNQLELCSKVLPSWRYKVKDFQKCCNFFGFLHFSQWKQHQITSFHHIWKANTALQCCLQNKVSKNIFGFVCSLQTLLDCHASGPDLSALGILNISHPTLMAPPVSDEMCVQIIVWHDEQHLSAQEITGLVGCSVWTVYSILSYHHDYNTLRDPLTCGLHGANHSLNMGDMNYISSLIDTQPKIYLDEIQDELLNRRDIFVSISILSCTLHWLSMTCKDVASEAISVHKSGSVRFFAPKMGNHGPQLV